MRMGLSEWWTYALSTVAYCPDKLGVYELGDEERITVYYGYGKIRTRLLEHLNQNGSLSHSPAPCSLTNRHC